MDKAVKIKIIMCAGFGLFVLVVVAVCISLTSSGEDTTVDEVNTSLRAQTESDFTIDDMMKADGKPDYTDFSDEVYQERATDKKTKRSSPNNA